MPAREPWPVRNDATFRPLPVLFQHAVQGWCPPIPLLRRLGIRTSREIEIERVALKILRGDFGEATRWANGRAIESDRALRAAKA